jgi:protein-tyrosine phosphatase/membrane-associated phospholipid phosphatase
MKINGKSIAASAGLSTLFLLIYPLCNWITSRRPHVGSYVFAWERHTPFVPALIIPYMSIDLFFVLAPFLTRSARELRTLTLRIAATILLAGACFLLFPLKFAFERPHVDGPLGLIFNNFRNMDLPFNQCPSLHVALWAILIGVYTRSTRGLLRIAIVIWFVLILFSTVLTYQHHFIDVVGGFVLAGFCFYLIPEHAVQKSFTFNHRVGIYYAIGAVVFASLALVVRPFSYVLVLPAVALAISAAGYVALGSNIFRKRGGAIPFSTWFVLWPVLIGQRVSLSFYARQCRPCNRLTDSLWIGRRLSTAEARQAQIDGVTAVVDLTGELAESKPFRPLNYLPIPILDLTAPHPAQIDQAINFIRKNSERGIVYLHCKAGYSRTAVVAGAYLLADGKAHTVESALAMLRKARPTIVIRPEAMKALDDFHSALRIRTV